MPTEGNLSVALLLDLVTNTLDPGYAAAAARRRLGSGPSARQRRWQRALLAAGCLLIGFTLVSAYIETHRSAPETAKVNAALVTRVRAAESAGDKLTATAQALSSRINTLRGEALSRSTPLRNELQNDQLLAGTLAVKGPGVLVQLANPPVVSTTAAAARPGTTPVSAVQLITDRDLRSVVNQLWIDGAEAISVNNIRLTPTSAIRFAGEAVLVDYVAINGPYSVRAIGDANQLDTGFAESPVASRYQTLAAADGIGFSFDENGNLAMPASTVGDPRYAQAVTSVGPSPVPVTPQATHTR